MTGTNNPGRRRRLLVRPELQRRIVSEVVRIPSLAFALSFLVLGVLALKLRGEAAAAQIVLPSLLPCLIAAASVGGIGIVALFVQAVRFSNRIVGPTVNVHGVIDSALAGSPQLRVMLREHDYAQELSNDINRLLRRIEELEAGQPSSYLPRETMTDSPATTTSTASDPCLPLRA